MIFKKQCPGYIGSQFYKDKPLGSKFGDWVIQDLEKQTFSDECFDIVITQDVYEHIFDPATATAEIYRTLKSGGVSILTTGIFPEKMKTEHWAALSPSGDVLHLVTPPEYHGNPIDKGGSIVTYKFGHDFADLLASWAPFDVEIWRFKDRHHGILGPFTDVIICHKR